MYFFLMYICPKSATTTMMLHNTPSQRFSDLLCNKEFGWPLSPAPGRKALNPRNFSSDSSDFVIPGSP